MNYRRWLLVVFIVILSSVFFYAGIAKVVDLRGFQDSILDYQLVGIRLSGVLALWLPWMEIVCATALFFRRFRLSALMSLGAMLVLFIFLITVTIFRGIDISCGCFGSGSGGLYLALFVDVLLLSILLAALFLHRSALFQCAGFKTPTFRWRLQRSRSAEITNGC